MNVKYNEITNLYYYEDTTESRKYENENLLDKFCNVIKNLKNELDDIIIRLSLSKIIVPKYDFKFEESSNIPYVLYQIIENIKTQIKNANNLLDSINKCGICSVCKIPIQENSNRKFYCCTCLEYHCSYCHKIKNCIECGCVISYEDCQSNSDFCNICKFEN